MIRFEWHQECLKQEYFPIFIIITKFNEKYLVGKCRQYDENQTTEFHFVQLFEVMSKSEVNV